MEITNIKTRKQQGIHVIFKINILNILLHQTKLCKSSIFHNKTKPLENITVSIKML